MVLSSKSIKFRCSQGLHYPRKVRTGVWWPVVIRELAPRSLRMLVYSPVTQNASLRPMITGAGRHNRKGAEPVFFLSSRRKFLATFFSQNRRRRRRKKLATVFKFFSQNCRRRRPEFFSSLHFCSKKHRRRRPKNLATFFSQNRRRRRRKFLAKNVPKKSFAKPLKP